jgi:hypothetical protein
MLKNSMLWVAVIFIGCSSALAGTITVDGDLKDWIARPAGVAGDWSQLRRPGTTLFTEEDQNTPYLNPGYGGQTYDAEAMYLEVDSNMLYVAVVTGLRPDHPAWKPGDLAIDFGNDQVYEYGIVTVGDAVSGHDAWNAGIGTAGQVYRVAEWNLGLWGAPNSPNDSATPTDYQRQHPTSIKSGALIGSAAVSYALARYDGNPLGALGALGGNHYLIEAAIPLNLFPEFSSGAPKGFTVHWTMGCANDWIALDPPGQVSEPSGLGLMGLGLVGLLGRQKGRKLKAR